MRDGKRETHGLRGSFRVSYLGDEGGRLALWGSGHIASL